MPKVRIRFGEYEIEIEDTEKSLDELLKIVRSEFRSMDIEKNKTKQSAKTAHDRESQSQGNTKGIELYPNVYSISEDKLSIICDLGISTKSIAIKTLAKLYLYGKYLMGEEGPINVEEIKEECKNHGRYDPGNFMTHLKNEKENIQITGRKNDYRAKLTMPGIKEAKELAEKYNEKREG